MSTVDRLYFYSRSKNDYPGKGPQERVDDSGQYYELSHIQNWRQVLSNFHVAPFKYQGHTYNTIEHAFQAKKIALVSSEEAYRFTRESNDEIGAGDGEVARKWRMLVRLNPEQIAQWAKTSTVVMAEAAACKYSECDLARQVLLATGDAQLWHAVSAGEAVRFNHLEELREQFREAAA